MPKKPSVLIAVCAYTPSKFLTLSQFIRYSLENGNTYDMSWVELWNLFFQNKWILILSDNFDRSNELGWIAVGC